MRNIEPIKLAEFRNEMMYILKKKSNKYQNTWKNVEIDYLLYKLKKQLSRINLKDTNKYIQKRLLHIANYSYLIYQKLEGN